MSAKKILWQKPEIYMIDTPEETNTGDAGGSDGFGGFES